MKIAIHDNKKEHFFSKRWIAYCGQNNIAYKIVNAYDNDIIDQVKGCDAFMWHHSNYDYRDALLAKQLIYSLETIGIKVFPDFYTTWHFDDKVGQKYLLETIGAPMVPSHVFYTKKDANNWIKETSFPKVFKLRGGSGSSNVKLVETKSAAMKLVNKAFGGGFNQFDRLNHLNFRYKNFKAGKEGFEAILKGIARLFIGNNYSNMVPKEKGYVYFQDFIPNNKFDTRVVVVNGRAAAEKRMVRKGDFRASGSGQFSYDDINIETIKIALEISNKLKLQSCAYDFVVDENNCPLIVEISYGFGVDGINNAPGYWDSSMQWHEGMFLPQEWMVENIIKPL